MGEEAQRDAGEAGGERPGSSTATLLRAAFTQHQSSALQRAEELYRQVLAQDPGNADALHHLGIACSQQGRYDEAIDLIGEALTRAPSTSAMHSNLGNALLAVHRYEDAVASYRRAIALDPRNATAHRNLGSALNALEHHDEALESYRAAIDLRPGYAEAHHSRGLTLAELERNDEALAAFERAVALRPDYPEALNNLGIMLRLSNRHREALTCVERALALEPQHADSHWNRAIIRLALGDFRGGWEDYEWRGRARPGAKPREFTQPLWLGEEPLAGKTILLHAEQGLGDTLQFVRYATPVARLGARVVLLVPRPLERLLACVEGVSSVCTAIEALPHFDCHCPLMSLPRAFGTELASVPAAMPYLRANDAAAAHWRERFGRGTLKVGLVWAGAAREHDPRAHRVDRRRSVTLAELAPLATAARGVSFVSLQKGPPALQARDPPPAMNLVDFTSELGDFADTAAMVAALDLVVSVDTSVAHLAGALGKPVWILSRFDGCWRWLIDREDSPWYPTARIFHQPAVGDWESVVARVAGSLADWASAARPA